MQLLIDIPEEMYNDIINGYTCEEYADELIANYIPKGTPLPKGYGKLIAESEIREYVIYDKSDEDCGYIDARDIDDMQAVVKEGCYKNSITDKFKNY